MAFAANNLTIPATSQEFEGDEFSNNLFSDLAPLLTLFGEQVTKQFLSMSMGWADNILLAMGPLGIMTVVVSAIRVGGVKKLKAVVGRSVVNATRLFTFLHIDRDLTEHARASRLPNKNSFHLRLRTCARCGAASRSCA